VQKFGEKKNLKILKKKKEKKITLSHIKRRKVVNIMQKEKKLKSFKYDESTFV
jgi:hypothetical protein